MSWKINVLSQGAVERSVFHKSAKTKHMENCW